MRKAAIIIFSVFISQCISAQYCGNSGPSICTSTSMPVDPGLYPSPDSFPSFYNNFISSATIQFRNFDTIIFGNEVLPVYSLKWDTIENLPPNLCWSTNKTDNTYARGETGCIHISGLACGATGQYKLSTLVTVDIGIPVETDGDPGGLKYFVRLQNYGDADVPVDNTQTASMPFISYGGICQSLTPPVVNLGPDQTVCASSIVTFKPVVTSGQPPYTYLWQSVGSNIICATCPNASVTVAQNSEYILKVTDASGGFGYDTVYYTVAGTPYNFQITSTQPDIFCEGGTVTLSANANDSVSFQWYANENVLPGETGNTLVVTDTSGAYKIVYTEVGICQATSNIVNILFYDTTPVTISSIGRDTICVGGEVTLIANAEGAGLSYAWLQDGVSLSYTATSLDATIAGSYQVAVTNLQGCTDTSSAVLVVASPNFPTSVSYGQFMDDTLCNNATVITLSGGEPSGGYYSGAGVSNGVFDPGMASAGLNFVYYNYTDSTGCGSSVYDTVVVLLCTSEQGINAENDIELYPNPVTDRLMVESALLQQEEVRIILYDVTGKRLFTRWMKQDIDKVSVYTGELTAGCYLLYLESGGARVTRRFIKTE